MANVFHCPSCGHKHRVADDRIGEQQKCMACGEVFKLSPGRGIAEPATQPTIEADDSLTYKLLKKAVDDPAAVIDAAIPGAISGVLTGVLVAILVGIPTGRPFGEVITKVLVGFVIGFA